MKTKTKYIFTGQKYIYWPEKNHLTKTNKNIQVNCSGATQSLPNQLSCKKYEFA